jgi:hypothetical protein
VVLKGGRGTVGGGMMQRKTKGGAALLLGYALPRGGPSSVPTWARGDGGSDEHWRRQNVFVVVNCPSPLLSRCSRPSLLFSSWREQTTMPMQNVVAYVFRPVDLVYHCSFQDCRVPHSVQHCSSFSPPIR